MPNPPVELKTRTHELGRFLAGRLNDNHWSAAEKELERIDNDFTSLTARVEALEKAGDALYRILEDISEDGEAMDQWGALAEGGGD